MRMPLVMTSFDLPPFSAPTSVLAVRHPLEGRWQGVWFRNGLPIPMASDFKVGMASDFKDARNLIEGSFCCPDLEVGPLRLQRIGYSAPRLNFEIPLDAAAVVFDGVIRGDTIEGIWRDGETMGRFTLQRSRL